MESIKALRAAFSVLLLCYLVSGCDIFRPDSRVLSEFKEATPIAKEIGQCVGAAGNVEWKIFQPDGNKNPKLRVVEAALTKGNKRFAVQWLYNLDTKVDELVFAGEPGETTNRLLMGMKLGIFCMLPAGLTEEADNKNVSRSEVPQSIGETTNKQEQKHKEELFAQAEKKWEQEKTKRDADQQAADQAKKTAEEKVRVQEELQKTLEPPKDRESVGAMLDARKASIDGNMGTSKPQTVGYDSRKSGGIFQIERLGIDSADFKFSGWNRGIKHTPQNIEVRRGNNADIRLAVVRKMIAIVRESESGDFQWESHKLRRWVTLSARAQDNAGLEDFMLREFFDDALGRTDVASLESTGSRFNDVDVATAIDQYRLALLNAARPYKRYPAQAMQNGWSGKAEIRLFIGVNGMIQSAAIKVSTGFSMLDDTALDMIKKAKPSAQIPPALKNKEFTVDVPVMFDLTSDAASAPKVGY